MYDISRARRSVTDHTTSYGRRGYRVTGQSWHDTPAHPTLMLSSSGVLVPSNDPNLTWIGLTIVYRRRENINNPKEHTVHHGTYTQHERTRRENIHNLYGAEKIYMTPKDP
jgi:hypothetical protein